ncbi:hypothetical protein [Deinococcus peraridilitoris]|uniref:hypothetical protein n=1 Tax=Deinococcus peraridilitoris TaxID=432329 RepID=UPI0012FBEA29|nr:hypothetical protein [Deinococcus peraridilitoris]
MLPLTRPKGQAVAQSASLKIWVDAPLRLSMQDPSYTVKKVSVSARARENGQRCKPGSFEFLQWDSSKPINSLGRNNDFKKHQASFLTGARKAGWNVRLVRSRQVWQHYTFTRNKQTYFALLSDPKTFPASYQALICRTR